MKLKKYLKYLVPIGSVIVLVLIFIFVIQPLLIVPTGSSSSAEPSASTSGEDQISMKIAFFISDADSLFEQAQLNEAKNYAKEKYGADVLAFDSTTDLDYMSQNFDQIESLGIQMVSLNAKDSSGIKDKILELMNKGVIVNTYYNEFADTGIPVIKSEEAAASFEIGKQMAQKWKETQPDKPIVMAQFGYPQNPSYTKGRTEAFVQGVLSVDSAAKDLGCMDISKGSEAVKLLALDLCEKHPEVNLLYCEDGSGTNALMDALYQAGRGSLVDGVPSKELVCSADFDQMLFNTIFDPESSVKYSLGLSAVEVAHLRIDSLFDIKAGTLEQTTQPAKELTTPAFCISYWTMTKDDANDWIAKEMAN